MDLYERFFTKDSKALLKPERPGKRGSKPKKGSKQLSLLERIADPSTKWTTIEIMRVVVRDLKGKLRMEAFLSTNLNVCAKQLLALDDPP